MRWATMADREPHPLHWVWLWAPALILLLFLGMLMGMEWLEKQKRRLIGPSEDCWRPWLAWYPVRIEGGQTAWLEWVERKTVARDWVEYRASFTGD